MKSARREHRARLAPLLLSLAMLMPAAPAAGEESARDLVSLSVSVREEVDNDLLVVRMYAEHQANKQAAASRRVNEDMQWALAAARKVAAVRAQTLDYRTNPVYRDRRVQGWRARQSLRLESTDTDALTALLATLQERLAIESIAYEVSDAVREAAEDRLVTAAIDRFSARAGRIAAAFGRSGYTLARIDIQTTGRVPPPVAFAGRTVALEAERASPVIEAGVRTITVTASGTIQLTPAATATAPVRTTP